MVELEPLHTVVDRHIRQALDAHGGSVWAAAKAIKVGRATLYRWVAGRKAAAGPSRGSLALQERRQVRLAALTEAREAWRGTPNVGALERRVELLELIVEAQHSGVPRTLRRSFPLFFQVDHRVTVARARHCALWWCRRPVLRRVAASGPVPVYCSWACHRKETAALAGRRAEARKAAANG